MTARCWSWYVWTVKSERLDCAHSSVSTLCEAKEAVEAYAESDAPRALARVMGPRSDGQGRVVVLRSPLIHDAPKEAVASILKNGFQASHRNPVLFGFSFWPGKARVSLRSDRVRLKAYLAGPIWDVSSEGTYPMDVISGRSADEDWNAHVRHLTQKAKLDWALFTTPGRKDEFWKGRERLATYLRREVLDRGFAGVWVGGEVVVVDLCALHVVRP